MKIHAVIRQKLIWITLSNGLFIFCILFAASGCSELNREKSPVSIVKIGTTFSYTSPATTGKKTSTENGPYFRTAYTSAAGNDIAQKAVRAAIAHDLMREIDEEYHKFERALRSDRAYKDVVTQFGSIGLSAAATVTGTSSVKSILSVIDTGLKGANATIDKTVFWEKASETLISQMRASRAKVANQIFQGLDKSPSAYPLEALLRDIGSYYDAGNVTSALVDLANQTNDQAKEAEKTVRETRGFK
jgi:hypothetical protein